LFCFFVGGAIPVSPPSGIQIDTAEELLNEVKIELITVFRDGAQCHRQAVQGAGELEAAAPEA
jgi:hypothetical protein